MSEKILTDGRREFAAKIDGVSCEIKDNGEDFSLSSQTVTKNNAVESKDHAAKIDGVSCEIKDNGEHFSFSSQTVTKNNGGEVKMPEKILTERRREFAAKIDGVSCEIKDNAEDFSFSSQTPPKIDGVSCEIKDNGEDFSFSSQTVTKNIAVESKDHAAKIDGVSCEIKDNGEDFSFSSRTVAKNIAVESKDHAAKIDGVSCKIKDNGEDSSLSSQTKNNAVESKGDEDPPSKLTRKFIHKQKAPGGEAALDLELDIEEVNEIASKEAEVGDSSIISSSHIKPDLRIGKADEDDEDPSIEDELTQNLKKDKLCTLAVLQWASLILILAALMGLYFWKWEVMVLALMCGRLLSAWIIRVVVFFIELNFLLRERILYFVYGVRNDVRNCLWIGIVLLAWNYMFDDKVMQESNATVLLKITRVLLCILVATLICVVKTLLVKILASSFHVNTYFERIRKSLFNQYVIKTLSGPPLIEIHHAKRKSMKLLKKENRKQQDAISIDQLHGLKRKNVSAWNMKRMMKMVRNGALITLDERLTDKGGEDEPVMQIKNEVEAKIAAKKIFSKVAKPDSEYIYLIDLMRFMREDEARKAMSLFEGVDENGRVSRGCLKNWVVNAFRERSSLSLTLNYSKTAVNTLHRMANVLVGIIVVALSLPILNIASTHFFVFIGSQLLVAVFMFGNTLKMTFEAIIFLFVMHPFDVGDRCEIDGVQMVVEEMNILTTIFLRYDNQKITYPNSVLATKHIGNFYRSPDMGDSIDFCVHVSTPLEKIAIMKERIIGSKTSIKLCSGVLSCLC